MSKTFCTVYSIKFFCITFSQWALPQSSFSEIWVWTAQEQAYVTEARKYSLATNRKKQQKLTQRGNLSTAGWHRFISGIFTQQNKFHTHTSIHTLTEISHLTKIMKEKYSITFDTGFWQDEVHQSSACMFGSLLNIGGGGSSSLLKQVEPGV